MNFEKKVRSLLAPALDMVYNGIALPKEHLLVGTHNLLAFFV